MFKRFLKWALAILALGVVIFFYLNWPVIIVLAKMDKIPADVLKWTPSGVPKQVQGELQLFVLVGQSNMSGRGRVEWPIEWDRQLFELGNDDVWRVATEPVDSSQFQVDAVSAEPLPHTTDYGSPAGYSPAVPFGLAMLAETDAPIGLIPCALQDSLINDWQRDLSRDSLYGSCLRRVQLAQEMGELAGILVYQGESDGLDPLQFAEREVSAETYTLKFTQFITDFRSDLRAPNLPVVYAQIATTQWPDVFTHWELIQEQQAAVILNCSRMITTDDLALRDFAHLTKEGYQTVGSRYASAYLSLIENEICE